MKKFTPYIIALLLGIGLLTTNPSQLSAPQLMLSFVVLMGAIAIALRSVFKKLKQRLHVGQDKAENTGGKSQTVALMMFVVIFLYLLNLSGTLTLRDMLLAIFLGAIVRFYLQKRFYANSV